MPATISAYFKSIWQSVSLPVAAGAICFTLSLITGLEKALSASGHAPLALPYWSSYLTASAGVSLLFVAIGALLLRWQRLRSVFLLTVSLVGTLLAVDQAAFDLFQGPIPWSQLHRFNDLIQLQSSIWAQFDPVLVLNLSLLLVLLREATLRQRPAPWHLTTIASALLGPLMLLASLYLPSDSRLTHPLLTLRQDPYPPEYWRPYQAADRTSDLVSLRFGTYSEPDGLQTAINQWIAERQPHRRPKNLVLLVLESVGSEQLLDNSGQPSPEVTPLLHRLAKSGLLLDQIYVPTPNSDNATLRMISGGIGPTWNDSGALYDFPYLGMTLGRALQQRGYRTALFSAQDLAFHNFRSFLQQAGYHHYQDFGLAPEAEQQRSRLNSWGGADHATINQAISWLRGLSSEQPFFLHFLANSPHHPYNYPQEPSGEQEPSELNDYQRALHYVDRSLQRLEKALQDRDLLKDTLIVVTGDHGDPYAKRLFQQQGNAARSALSETTVRSFFLIFSPGQAGGTAGSVSIPRHGNLGDLAATVWPLLGLPEEDTAGQNLLSAAHQPQVQYFYHNAPLNLGLRDGQWKFLSLRRGAEHRLFDLVKDPGESRNLAPLYPEKVDTYLKLAMQWYLDENHTFSALLADYSEGSALDRAFDAKVINQPRLQRLETGLLSGDEHQAQFVQRARFHPTDTVLLRSQWLHNASATDIEVEWLAPDRQLFRKPVHLRGISEIHHFGIPAPSPLQTGIWQARIKEGQQVLAEQAFEVVEPDQLAPSSLPLLRKIEIGISSDKGLQRPEALSPTQTFSIASSWHPAAHDRSYQLYLLSPDETMISLPLLVAAGWQEHQKQLTPPAAMQPGRWEVVIADGPRVLGQQFFLVTAPAE